MTVHAIHPVQRVRFGSLRIDFDDRVLRPRPWTVAQSRWAAELADEVPAGPVLELCAGAGQIGLLAVLGKYRRLVSVDVSTIASSYTLRNARTAGLYGRVEVRTGPMDEVLAKDGRFPLIIADPPWVPTAHTADFPHDPVLAIDGGADGMGVVRTTLDVIATHLALSGAAVLQVGSLSQATTVGSLVERAGLLRVETTRQEERGVLVLLRPVDAWPPDERNRP